MKKIIVLVLVISSFFIGIHFRPITVTTVINVQAKVPETVEEWIIYYAELYKVDPKEMDSVVFCESGYNVVASGDGGKAFSVAQFHKPTFDSWKVEMGQPELNWKNFQHQLKVMAWGFSQGSTYKDDWTCWKG